MNPRNQVEIKIHKNDYLTISFIGDINFAGRWYGTPETLREKLRSFPHKSERDTVLDVGGILESLCKTDLYWYNKGVTEGEDVGICRGKDCNYCGRYNEKLRHQAGEP